ncbi:MAG: hypothetical protein RO257_15640 [Candidatus Kapabacteria bacterium]|nr:hypothetical protein [Candidatus Kapabacteria bacterium]
MNNTGGTIKNGGTIRVKNGNASNLPDTLDGRVEFLQGNNDSQQRIPNIVYHQLVISNKASKLVSDEKADGGLVRSIVVRDSLIVSDSAIFTTRWSGVNSEDVHAKASVTNTAKFTGKKDMVLSGTDKTQDLIGNGSFSRIRVENPFGVDVRGGGFQLNEQLTLKKGELRNSADSNFIMADSTLLIRHVGSSLAYEPSLDKQISVHYDGTGDLTTGPEIPKQKDALKNLNVKVSGTLTLDRNVTVEDSLHVGAMISALKDTLALQGRTNPVFSGGPDIEIAGNFRRNTLTAGDTIMLNSPNIWVYFEDAASMGTLRNLVSTILPMTFHNLPLADSKVRRAYTLFGTDTDGNEVTEGFAMDFGFKHREINDPNKDESNGLTASELVLQQWLDDEWIDIVPNQPISLDFGTGWAMGMVQKLNKLGQFAIGMPSASLMAFTFQATFYLEGPYIAGSQGFMKHELWSRNLIELADLAAYPTNLDTKLAPDFLTQIPDSVVDIVVLEFRTDRNSPPSIVKTGFLRYDGTFVDRNGKPGIELRKGIDIDSQGAKYHVVVRQRNHSSVITDMPVDINLETEGVVYNLSDPGMVEGGSASLKLVYSGENGKKVFALKGGFLADDAEGLNNQLNMLSYYTRNIEHQTAFDYFTRIGYLNADYNLSGIVNTKDFNVTWNNRGLK